MANCPKIKITQQNQLVKWCFRKKPGRSGLTSKTVLLYESVTDSIAVEFDEPKPSS